MPYHLRLSGKVRIRTDVDHLISARWGRDLMRHDSVGAGNQTRMSRNKDPSQWHPLLDPNRVTELSPPCKLQFI